MKYVVKSEKDFTQFRVVESTRVPKAEHWDCPEEVNSEDWSIIKLVNDKIVIDSALKATRDGQLLSLKTVADAEEQKLKDAETRLKALDLATLDPAVADLIRHVVK